MTVLVTGATGNIGGEVIRHLLNQNVPIRALVRDRKKAAKLTAQGIELAQGDFSQPDTLTAALHGIDRAFLVMPNDPRQVELECAFVDAAKQAGVQHVVKLSVMKSGELPSTFQKWHRQIEEHLEQSGMAWTHLRPNMLMQNMRWFAQTIARDDAFYSSLGNAQVSHVDGRDVAAVAAVCLTEAGHENTSYVLTGVEALTFDQVAAIFTEMVGRSVRYVDLPPANSKAARLANGEPEWYLDAELELLACWKAGHGSEMTTTIADLLDRSPTSFADFAQDFVQTQELRKTATA